MKNINIDKYIKAVGEIIIEVRKSRNISSKQAANNLNLSPSYYSRLENIKGGNKVSLLLIFKLVDNINIKLSDVLFEAEKKINSNYISNTLSDYNSKIQSEDLLKCLFNEIKEERKSKGISQYKIAKDMGIVRQYYSDIERGKNKSISLYRLLEITEVIGTPLCVLVERAERSLLEKDNNVSKK